MYQMHIIKWHLYQDMYHIVRKCIIAAFIFQCWTLNQTTIFPSIRTLSCFPFLTNLLYLGMLFLSDWLTREGFINSDNFGNSVLTGEMMLNKGGAGGVIRRR